MTLNSHIEELRKKHEALSLAVEEAQRSPGSVGIATGTEIAIIDAQRTFLPEGASGEVVIRVVRGAAANENEVDGITGATRSTTGVSNLVGFWLGDWGFGLFLARLKAGEE